MTTIQQRLSTGRGKFTTDYPELGTAPVSYEDCVSEEFFAAERKTVFERNWLCVGRIERLPRKGSYFTRDLPGRLASIANAVFTPAPEEVAEARSIIGGYGAPRPPGWARRAGTASSSTPPS